MNPRRAFFVLTCVGVGAAPASLRVAAGTSREDSIGAGVELDAVDESGNKVHLRIDGVEVDPKDPDKETLLYAVSARDAGGTWVNYCLPGPDGLARAIPMQGSWDASGTWHDGDGVITMACTGGAVAKCVRFGYKPWKSVHGVSLRDYHQACTRMVRADYCGDGRSHTIDGTWIDMDDILQLQKPDPPDSRPERFEAGWGPGGATYLSHPRWTNDIAPIVAQCPAHFAGRTGGELPQKEIVARWPETLMFNRHFARIGDKLVGPPPAPPGTYDCRGTGCDQLGR